MSLNRISKRLVNAFLFNATPTYTEAYRQSGTRLYTGFAEA